MVVMAKEDVRLFYMSEFYKQKLNILDGGGYGGGYGQGGYGGQGGWNQGNTIIIIPKGRTLKAQSDSCGKFH